MKGNSQTKTRSPGLNRLLLLVSALLFSTGGVAIKGCGMTSWQIGGFRSGIAAVVMWVLLPEARRNWTWRSFAAGTAYAAMLISFVVANKLTTAANAVFLQSTAPFYMLFLGPLVLRERIRRADLVVFAAIAGGAGLLLYSSGQGAGTTPASAFRNNLGNLIAALSGLAWALTLTSLRWLGKHSGDGPGASGSESHEAAAAAVIAGNLIAFAVCLPLALPVAGPSPRDLASLGYLGIFQVGLAYVFLTRSIRHVPAFEAATLLLAEPTFNPVWAWLFRGEKPGGLVLLGGAIIVLAAFFASVRPAIRKSEANS